MNQFQDQSQADTQTRLHGGLTEWVVEVAPLNAAQEARQLGFIQVESRAEAGGLDVVEAGFPLFFLLVLYSLNPIIHASRALECPDESSGGARQPGRQQGMMTWLYSGLCFSTYRTS
ncbi:MAG: hypothetical protein FRX49_02701 [Trebouxia sp. A1-2]|nr:MAG: hypothetical protein FRX49_02701 [Trebouxia sp. A1-2]